MAIKSKETYGKNDDLLPHHQCGRRDHRHGFRDATGSYRFATSVLTDVWLGDSPMDINEGAEGDQVLRVQFPDDVDIGEFEVIEEHKPYREWCVPAVLINTHTAVTLMNEDGVDEFFRQRAAHR
jgi:hypothetical protein